MSEERVAVVTGGSRGIGKATALALGIEGYTVIICSKNKERLAKAEKDLKSVCSKVMAVVCDLSNPPEVKAFTDKIKKNFNEIDVLINNAGVAYYKPLIKFSEKEIEETVDVNLKGMIILTKNMLPIMKKGGVIINISSGAGKAGFAGLAAYCTTKFGVLGFTESLADELKDVKVVAICPGGVDTDMYRNSFGDVPSLKPEHIAAKILHICTNPKKYKSGSSVDIFHVTDALNYMKLKYFNK